MGTGYLARRTNGGGIVSYKTADYILYALGVILTGVCFASVGLVLKLARRFDMDDFSNPADFPVVSARRWMTLIGVNMVLCWVGVLSESRMVMAAVMLLLAVSSVIFIISALHPNRNQPMETESPTQVKKFYHRSLSEQKRLEILSSVTTVVEEQEAYLDPHLTLQAVADRCGFNRSYVAGLIKSELGGFFTYVNRLRVQHVDRYLEENPSATVLEAAEESGFVSRKAYYAAKAKLREE